MLQINILQDIKIYILCSKNFFPLKKTCFLRDNVEKYAIAIEYTDDNTIWSREVVIMNAGN